MSALVAIGNVNFVYYQPFLSASILSAAEREDDIFLYGVESDGMACGAAACRLGDDEAEILWFALDPEFRGKGIGSESFGLLLKELKVMGAKTAFMRIPPDADEILKQLFKTKKAKKTELPECEVRTTVGAVRGIKRLVGHSKSVMALRDVDEARLRRYGDGLNRYYRDLLPLPIKKKDYLGLLSSVYIRNGEVKAALLFQNRGNELYLSFIGSITKVLSAVMYLFYYSFDQVAKLPEKTPLVVCLVEEHTRKFMEYLFRDLDPSAYEIRPMEEYRVKL